MPYSHKKATGHVRGMAADGTWQSAIRRNGEKPTIYPHTKGDHGQVHGFSSKHDPLGKWHHCPKR